MFEWAKLKTSQPCKEVELELELEMVELEEPAPRLLLAVEVVVVAARSEMNFLHFEALDPRLQ